VGPDNAPLIPSIYLTIVALSMRWLSSQEWRLKPRRLLITVRQAPRPIQSPFARAFLHKVSAAIMQCKHPHKAFFSVAFSSSISNPLQVGIGLSGWHHSPFHVVSCTLEVGTVPFGLKLLIWNSHLEFPFGVVPILVGVDSSSQFCHQLQ
jgi:hypothetical protein